MRGGVSRRSTVANDRDVPGSYGNYGGGAARGANGHTPARDDWEDEKVDRSRRMSSAHMDHRRSESRFADTTVVPNSVLNHYASMHRRPTHRVSRNGARAVIEVMVAYLRILLIRTRICYRPPSA